MYRSDILAASSITINMNIQSCMNIPGNWDKVVMWNQDVCINVQDIQIYIWIIHACIVIYYPVLLENLCEINTKWIPWDCGPQLRPCPFDELCIRFWWTNILFTDGSDKVNYWVMAFGTNSNFRTEAQFIAVFDIKKHPLLCCLVSVLISFGYLKKYSWHLHFLYANWCSYDKTTWWETNGSYFLGVKYFLHDCIVRCRNYLLSLQVTTPVISRADINSHELRAILWPFVSQDSYQTQLKNPTNILSKPLALIPSDRSKHCHHSIIPSLLGMNTVKGYIC